MLDGMDADGEWSDEDGVKSGSATALSDNEPDDRHTTRKTLPTIPGTPTNQKIDPVHAILDKIDAELGAIAAANNITTFSQPVSVKKSSYPSFDRTKLEAQGVVFDDNDRARTGHTRGGSSDRDTGVGTGSVHDDGGSEHKRIMGTAQIHSDVADLTDVQTDDGRKLDEGHSDLDSVAAQQIDEKFKEIMRKKRGGYLDDLRARIPRPESDRATVKSEEGVAPRLTDPPHRSRRSRSSGPQGKPPRPSPPRSCLTPPSSPRRGPADLPSYQRQTFLSPPVPKHSQNTSQLYTGYASDIDSVKTEDFESRFQDLIIGPHLKDSSSKLKPVSNKLSKADSNSQVQSEMNNTKLAYSKPPRSKPEPKSFLSSRIFSNFQDKPSNNSSLRMSSLSPSRPSTGSTSTGTNRPRSVSPGRLRHWSDSHRSRNSGLFSWDDDFWRTSSPRRSGSASTFEEVESLCLSKSSSSIESHQPRGYTRPVLSRSFTRESSITSNSTGTGASSGHDSSGGRSQSISSIGSALEDGESFELPNQLSDSTYMERIFQRVLDWRTGEQSNGAWKCENWNNPQVRPGSAGALGTGGQKKGRKKVLIIPDEEEEGIPFAKMKFNHKPDFKSEHDLKSISKRKLLQRQSSQSDESLSSRQMKKLLPSQVSVCSQSTDMSSWHDSSCNQTSRSESFEKARQSPVCSRAISVDNLSSFPPAPPQEFYAPYNPYLPVHAERMLMNLGFGGADSLLPERFLKDWYQKMQKAQQESQQLSKSSDGQETTDENINFSHDPSARSTPNTGYMFPEAMIPFPSQRFLQRSATVSSYHPDTEVSARKEQRTQEVSYAPRMSGSHLNGHSEFGSTRKRRQWANSRQKSLPLFLETLNEEDENRSKTSTSDQFSKLKAFLADELMSLKSSSSSQDNSHTDSESESSHAADNTQQETQEQETIESSKLLAQDNPLVRGAVNKYILTPSKDSLEVADIMQNTKSKKQKLLEPAMVSIVLEDVDGNVICNSSDPAKEDHLTIPCSQSCLATSPIPLSPVTVIEVSLDNQQDSVDTDDGPSSSRETDSGKSTNSFQNDKSKSKLSGNCSNIFSPEQESLQSYNVDNQFSFSVEADDGTLSPIIKFPPLGEVLTWLEESRDCEYYVAHDQGIQCEPERHSEHQHQDYADKHHVCQTHSKMADKEVQTSLTTVSNQTQTETDDSLEYDNTMYQRVISNYVASNDYVNLTREGEPVSTTSTVHTISPLFLNEGGEIDCLTDDWVISNFRSQTKQQHSLPKLVSQDRLCTNENNLTTDETEHSTRVHDETDSGEHASESVEKANNSLVKLNEDGSPMTKLDIFATQFLAEAEEMCSHMSHIRAKDEMRRDSIISSTLSDDSLGTVILNTKLRQKPSLSEDCLQKKDSFGADVDPFQGQSSTEDDAFSVTTASPLETSSFLMPWACTANTRSLALSRNPRHFDNSNEPLASEEFYRVSQAKMRKGIGGYKSQSMDLISGHVPLRRTHALSLPLDSMNAGSWSMFSTSVSSDSTDAESHQSISNLISVHGIGNQGNYRNHQLSIPTVFEQCQKQVESNVQICFQDDSDIVSHIPCDVPAQKQHLLKPSIRVSFESDETVTDEDIDDKPAPSEHITETIEDIVHPENTQVDISHLVSTEDSAYQEIKEVSESRTLCNDEHVEGEDETHGDKRILLKLLPNVHSQKTIEGSVGGSQRTEKQSVNSNSLGIVNQMTTIYESDSDMSDYEHYRKEKRKTNSHFEFTKSRSWNGTRKQMRLKSNLNVKSHSLNMGEKARGQFGRLARKAFIKTKTVRVQSPTSSSDQETAGKHNNISTEKKVQINQHNFQTHDESSIKDTSKSGEEDNEKVERYDETTLDSEGSIKSDHKIGKLRPENKSKGISFTLKRMFLTPSQAAEKSLTKEDVLRPDVTPYLDNSNSFKPIPSDDTLSSCSESSFESNYVPTAVKQGSFLQIPCTTPDHDFQDITNQRWPSEPMFLSPSSQGSSVDTTSSDMADASQGTPLSSPQSLISPTSREVLTLQKDSVFRSLSPADRRQLSRPIYATPVARKGIRSPEAERMLLCSEERNSKSDKGSKLSPVQSPIIGSRRLSSSGSTSAFKECYTSKSSSPVILQDRVSVSSSSPIVLHCDMSSENLNLVSPELGKYDKNPRSHLDKTPPQEMKWLKSEDTEPFHFRLLDRQLTEEQLHSGTLDQRQQSHSRSLEQRQLQEENQRKQEKNGHHFSLLDIKSHVKLGNGQILTPESSASLIKVNSDRENQFLLTDNTSVSEHESLSTLHPAPVASCVDFKSTSIGEKSISNDLRESKDEGFFSKELLEDFEETDKQSGDTYWKGYSRSRSHNQPKLSVSAIKSKFECGTKDSRTITNVTQSKKFVHQNIRHMISKYENC